VAGSVLPHYLTTRPSMSRKFDSDNFNNYAVRVGEVVQIHYPDDATNRSKNEIEYTVNVQFRRSNGVAVNTLYHCTVGDPFGTAGDSHRHTRRASRGQKGSDSLTDGARVLVACPNGETANAIIIGGVKHHLAKPDPKRADGDYLHSEFNGVQFDINDSGEFSVTLAGATLNDGTADDDLRDDHNKGTQVTFKKDGSLAIDNKSGESITIDTTNRKIQVAAKDHGTKTEDSWSVEAGGDVTVKAGGDARIEADGDIRLGGRFAEENLVLGKTLVTALNALIEQVFLGNSGTFASLAGGVPLQIHPALAAALAQWAAMYLASGPESPLLAQDKFTER
jgi:hypothetical protein